MMRRNACWALFVNLSASVKIRTRNCRVGLFAVEVDDDDDEEEEEEEDDDDTPAAKADAMPRDFV